MSIFQDTAGQEYRVQLDAFILDEIRKQTGIDLADVTAGGWQTVETDAGACVRVLAVVCGDEIRSRNQTARDFARAMRREAIDAGLAALVTEGADFFPRRRWLELQSNLQSRRNAAEQTNKLRTAMAALDAMPPEMRAGAAEAIADIIRVESARGMSGTSSPDSDSAPGPEVIPLRPATGSPEPAEYQPVG